MDAPTSFFFSFSAAESKQMSRLKLPNGSITTNPAEMWKHAIDFYTELFREETCDLKCRDKLLKDLPQLSKQEKDDLDYGLSRS